MKKVKRYAGMQESMVKTDEDAPIVVSGGSEGMPQGGGVPTQRQALSIAPGDYAPAPEPALDLGYTPQRERFDADVTRATSGMPGLSPQAARNRLDERGIDVSALMQKVGRKKGGVIKKMASGGMTSKVSSASKRADGIATKGKTKGRYI